MKVLVTGGAGYIGSTICSVLSEVGHVPIVLDSLISGRREFVKEHIFYQGDIADRKLLMRIWEEQGPFDCAIHLAGLISVPESVQHPYEYYRENVEKAIMFFKNLQELGCKKIIFSSSASVYGNTSEREVTEEHITSPESPYAKTKVVVEEILKDYANAYGIKAVALRYFNPIGADPKLRTGSYVKNPSHILGVLLRAAVSETKKMTVTGVNYPTRDGSGIRDYIHVWDLALAHVSAVEKIDKLSELPNGGCFEIINIGRGDGVTVKELIRAFEQVVGVKLDVEEGEPREGDVAGAFAVCKKAEKLLGWKAGLTIEEAIQDALLWEQRKKIVLNIE